MSSGKREKQLLPIQSLGTTFLATGNPQTHKTPVNIDPVSSNPCEIPPKLFKKSQGGFMMVDVKSLMSGIAVVIDDALNPGKENREDKIFQIVDKIGEELEIPFYKAHEIPCE